MSFERDIRTVTLAFCVFWCWCAGVGLYAQFPTAVAFSGQSYFDAVRLHVLDYLALAFIPTILLKEAVWALTRQAKRSGGGRHTIGQSAFQARSTSAPEEIDEGPFFLSPSVARCSQVTLPDKVSRAPDIRPRRPYRCRARLNRKRTQADRLVTFRDFVPERRAHRVALEA